MSVCTLDYVQKFEGFEAKQPKDEIFLVMSNPRGKTEIKVFVAL